MRNLLLLRVLALLTICSTAKAGRGVAWDGQALWIAEFDVKDWRLQV